MNSTLKFASYGRKASGKTCLLAALSMQHKRNKNGYEASWIRIPEEHKGDDAWVKAAERLIRTQENISKGDKVEATGIMIGHDPFLFRFSTPAKETFNIELIDYSGELIEPDISKESQGEELEEHLKKVDGIFVLIEVPPVKKDYSHDYSEVKKLQQAFDMLALKHKNINGYTIQIPVAIIITKFDRFYVPKTDDEHELNKEITKFLASKRGEIVNSFKTSLENLTNASDFKLFVTSAFGKCEKLKLGEGDNSAFVERPIKTDPLQSFEIETPFVWAAQRSIEIKFKNLEEYIDQINYYNPISLFSIQPNLIVLDNIANSLPEEKKEYLDVWRKKLSTAKLSFILWLCSALLIFALGFEVSVDSYHYIKLSLDKKEHKIQVADKEWLRNYVLASPLRHSLFKIFGLSKKEASIELETIYKNECTHQWDIVTNTKDLPKKILALQYYIKNFAQADNIASATSQLNNLTTEAALQAHASMFTKSLSSIKNHLERLQVENKIISNEEIEKLKNEVSILKNNQKNTPIQNKQVLDFEKKLTHFIESNLNKILAKEVVEKYDQTEDLMLQNDSSKWLRAIAILLDIHKRLEQKPKLIKEWEKRTTNVLAKLEDNLNNISNKDEDIDDWDESKQIYTSFMYSSNLGKLYDLLGTKNGINQLYGKFIADYSHFLYSKIRGYSQESIQKIMESRDTILSYIQKYKDSTVSPEDCIKNFEQYVNDINSYKAITLEFSTSDVGGYISQYNQKWVAQINGNQKTYTYSSGFPSFTYSFTSKLSDTVSIQLSEYSSNWDSWSYSSETNSYTLEELAKGSGLTLESKEGYHNEVITLHASCYDGILPPKID